MTLKIIFTWWNRQTFGTFLKTLFFGKYVGTDDYGNKYYQSKKNERWVIYSKNIEATKITSDWYLWIHHTTDKVPDGKDNKYSWQKKHLENLLRRAPGNNTCEDKRGSCKQQMHWNYQ